MLYKALQLKDSSIDTDKRTFEGYASTWDVDKTGDVIMPGAFAKSIKEAFPKNKIKVLWEHWEPLGMPLEMREDKTGLFVKARVSKTSLGDDALALMKDGVVDTMSIGFTIPANKSEINDQGQREIHEVKLMEFSPVTFPANDAAVITGVKSLSEKLQLAKSQGIQITDSAELVSLLTELKALIKIDEPPQSTQQDIIQPLVKESITVLDSLKSLSSSIRRLNYE